MFGKGEGREQDFKLGFGMEVVWVKRVDVLQHIR
jgi:hypothetical protein